MLATIATRLTDQLYFRCPLDPSRKAIYEYGIQLSLSTLASMCSIVMLGLLLKNPASAFIFLGVFFFLRLFSGGYHAPTYARCFLLTNSVYLAVVGTSYLIVRFQLYHLLPVIVVVSCVVVMALSPIRNKRHPLSEKTYRNNRKIAVVLVSIESSFFLILFFWRIFQPYYEFVSTHAVPPTKRGELTPDPVRLQPKAVSQDHEDWGLHPILDLDKIAHIPICRFLLKKDVPLVQETFDRQRRELQDAVNADPTGERFIKEMFLCELENHGFNYTGTAEDALDVLGLSFEDVAADPRLARGLELAEQELQEQQQTMGM